MGDLRRLHEFAIFESLPLSKEVCELWILERRGEYSGEEGRGRKTHPRPIPSLLISSSPLPSIPPHPTPKIPLILLTIIVLLIATFTELSESNPVPELLSLQSRSNSRVIYLNDRFLAKFLTTVKTPRPYWVLVFFDATKLHDKSKLHLKDNQDPSSLSHAKLFFCDIEFQES
ncbi:hypothetical protein ACFX11_019471 [Malus domestica]